MIQGTGIDIVELNRIAQIVERTPRFVTRILTPEERRLLESLPSPRKTEFIAGRYAAKEALSKALGCGIGARLSWQDISVLYNDRGAPVFQWCRNPQDVADLRFHLSISHSKAYAVAHVIIEKN